MTLAEFIDRTKTITDHTEIEIRSEMGGDLVIDWLTYEDGKLILFAVPIEEM